ncbi:MAG: L-threonylcarbamoyladenylate synthase [Xanthomonadaceae bacterium]|nr:L-threonylcarbamoyladenylate synthase [Xanthomonadaceae bacterium]
MSNPITTAVSDAELVTAVATLRAGGVIGLPTETVYGLAADADNAAAVARIFALKERPADHPLIVHIADATQLPRYARAVPEAARQLAAAFWPGPLTLILHRQSGVLDAVTGGQDTVGLRAPAHPLAQRVLRAFDGALAAPSANRFGRISPTCAEHVRAEFGDAVPCVLDGGPCAVGIESTIVDLTAQPPRILRPGVIRREQIEAVIGAVAMGAAAVSPRASGTLEAHYAPRTPLRLQPRHAIATAPASAQQVLALDTLPANTDGIALPADPLAYAHGLYAALRELDARGSAMIVVETPPADAPWLAIHDRLRRAAAGAGA